MAELIWSEQAIADIEDIYDYIANNSPFYARFTTGSVLKAIERLQVFPESGRHIPEFPHLPHREVITGSYRVIYRHDSYNDVVIIVTVAHGSRLLTEILPD